ncbi:uncharacterized protein V6R79_019030 [Siganus canaliculatus]
MVAQELLDIGARYGGAIEAEDLLPCARTVNRHVDGEFKKVKTLLLEELKQYRDYAITTDLWTEEKTNTNYITVTVRYIVNWEIKNRILATRMMEGVMSHAHIKTAVEEIWEYSVLVLPSKFNVFQMTVVKDPLRSLALKEEISALLKM